MRYVIGAVTALLFGGALVRIPRSKSRMASPGAPRFTFAKTRCKIKRHTLSGVKIRAKARYSGIRLNILHCPGIIRD